MINPYQFLHENDEKIVAFLRHHWVVYVAPLAVLAVLGALPIAAIAVIGSPSILAKPAPAAVGTLLLSAYYMTLWITVFTALLNSYLDVWIVTTKRLVYIEQHRLFSRTISEQPLARVQDVTSSVRGIFPTLMGYGSIAVQSAGATERFRFRSIAQPTRVARVILEHAHRVQNHHNGVTG